METQTAALPIDEDAGTIKGCPLCFELREGTRGLAAHFIVAHKCRDGAFAWKLAEGIAPWMSW